MINDGFESRIGFVGAGRLATALAPALEAVGFKITAVASRSQTSSAQLASRLTNANVKDRAQEVADVCDLVFLTVPDHVVEELAEAITWRPGTAVVHTSGVLNRQVLAAAASQGASTGSLHPLQTFAAVDMLGENARPDLWRIVFALEAEASSGLRQTLVALVESLGGSFIELNPEDKVLYHASAVMVSNYVVTLVRLASDLWSSFGIDQGNAVKALLPLVDGTVANLRTLNLADALTGPVARGDLSTIQSHLAALSREAPQTVEIYRRLAGETIPLALAQGGLAPSEAESLLMLLANAGREASESEKMEAQK